MICEVQPQKTQKSWDVSKTRIVSRASNRWLLVFGAHMVSAASLEALDLPFSPSVNFPLTVLSANVGPQEWFGWGHKTALNPVKLKLKNMHWTGVKRDFDCSFRLTGFYGDSCCLDYSPWQGIIHSTVRIRRKSYWEKGKAGGSIGMVNTTWATGKGSLWQETHFRFWVSYLSIFVVVCCYYYSSTIFPWRSYVVFIRWA